MQELRGEVSKIRGFGHLSVAFSQNKLFKIRDVLSQTKFLLQYDVNIIAISYSVRRSQTQKMQKRISFCLLFSRRTYTTCNLLSEIFVPNTAKCRPLHPLNSQNPLSDTKIFLHWPQNANSHILTMTISALRLSFLYLGVKNCPSGKGSSIFVSSTIRTSILPPIH